MLTLEELINLDYYTRHEKSLGDDDEVSAHERDRQIYLTSFDNDPAGRQPGHADCLREWLSGIQPLTESLERPPGEHLLTSLRIFKRLLILLGLMLGALGALAFFVYSGKTPLNILSFFSLFILPQLLILILFICRSVLSKIFDRSVAELAFFLRPLFAKIYAYRFGKRGGSIDKSVLELLFPPLFSSGQLFGIAFNVGLISVTLFKITTADLAFGWQSTLQISPETLHGVVEKVAIFWSWIIPESISLPTLEEIKGSRIILKDGIQDLATEHLVSWWPFLVLSLFFYGLMPRLVLLLLAQALEKRSVARFIKREKFKRISERMCTPLISTQAPPELDTEETTPPLKEPIRGEESVSPPQFEEATILLPEELAEQLDRATIDTYLAPHGYTSGEVIPIFKGYAEDQTFLEQRHQLKGTLIVVLEAWMPPINEQMVFLEKCSTGYSDSPTGLFFIGKISPTGTLLPPKVVDVQIWQKKIKSRCNDLSFIGPLVLEGGDQ